MSPFWSSFIAVFAISFLSLFLALILVSQKKSLPRLSQFLVSLAVGSLLGDAFIHLIPESFEHLSSANFSLLLSLGFFLFFILEKTLCWHHCSPEENHQHRHPIVAVNLATDSLHNFIDGLIIASSFSVNFSLGLATSLAVLFHEIPQEIGDFGIFIHQGLSPLRALLLNLLSALTAFLGVFLLFFLGPAVANLADFLLPFTAGGFIYLAASDLVPLLHSHSGSPSSDFLQFFFISLGLSIMFLLS